MAPKVVASACGRGLVCVETVFFGAKADKEWGTIASARHYAELGCCNDRPYIYQTLPTCAGHHFDAMGGFLSDLARLLRVGKIVFTGRF